MRRPLLKPALGGFALISATILSSALLVSPALGQSSAPMTKGSVGQWTTYGGTNSRSSNQSLSPPLSRLRVRWRTTQLDGQIYGEPLIFNRRVYVATESDVLYALNAGNGHVVWSRRLGTPVPDSALPCGDISPTVGVTGTMVIDPSTPRLFVSATTFAGGTVHHDLFAFTLAGSRVFDRDVDVPGWDSAAQLQRPALTLEAGRVVIAFGGNDGDCSRYHGYLLAVPESGRGAISRFQVPTQREGAIWGPSGVAVDHAGDLFAATGNGSSTTRWDGGDSVVELSPALRVLRWYVPANWAADNADDGDLGSTNPIIVGRDVFVVGKEQTGYLLDPERVGGISHVVATANICFSIGASATIGSNIIVSCPGDSLMGVRTNGRSLVVRWTSSAPISNPPTIAAGIVFASGNGELYGLSPTSGAVVEQIPSIGETHLAAPAAGEGLIVVGGSGALEAFQGPRGWLG